VIGVYLRSKTQQHDFVAPSIAALARVADARATQYWDRKRALSHLLGEHNRSTVVWDYIAVYAPGMLWQDAPPKPISRSAQQCA